MPEFILWFLVFLYHIQLVWSKMNVLAYTINHGFILSTCPIQYHLLCSPVFQNGVEQQCWKGNSQKDCIYGGEKNWFFILVRLIQGPLSYTISTWRISKAHRVTLNKQTKKPEFTHAHHFALTTHSKYFILLLTQSLCLSASWWSLIGTTVER